MYDENQLMHYGVLGMHWGVRRYQNEDGTRTNLGKRHERELEGNNSSSRSLKSKKISDGEDLDAVEARKAARRSKIKKGAAIAAGVLVAAGAGYALYKTGAGEKALNQGKSLLNNLLSSNAGKTAASKESAEDLGISISMKGGKKSVTQGAKAATASNNVNTGEGFSIGMGGKKGATSAASTASKPAQNLNSGNGFSVGMGSKKGSVSSTGSSPKPTQNLNSGEGFSVSMKGGKRTASTGTTAAKPVSTKPAPSTSTAPKSTGTNVTESGVGVKIPIKRASAPVAANTPVSSASQNTPKRRVVMRVINDDANRTANINSTYNNLNNDIISFTNSMLGM